MKFSGIEVEKLWLDELHEVSFMKNLTTLKVTNCSGLNYLSSFEVAKSLELLERLTLSDLEALKVVIVVKKQMDEVERTEKKLFPKLHTLKLINLQNMAEFCSQCSFEFPSLKVLRIKECLKVADLLDLIGRQSNLEILDLSSSSFVELPRGIERLTQLKSLDLSFCKYLKVIQPDVISKLIHLEELKMLQNHVTWGVEGVSSTCLSELKNLSQLTGLVLCVPDFSFLPKDFFSEKWKVCHIATNKGSFVSFSVDYRYSSKLQLHLKNREINVWECGLQVLLKKSEELLIIGLEDDMDDIVYELDKEGFPQLREFILNSCGGVRYLVNSIRHSSTAAFVSLERLILLNLTTLERICHGELIRGSFGKLWSVSVVKCARLKSLFPISFATQLVVLKVKDCEALKAIFTDEREDDNDLAFTELQSLSFGKLTRLEVVKCARLKNLFPISVAIQLVELKVMDCEAMEAIFTIEREDDNDLAFTELQSLSLKKLPGLVQFCSKLKTASTSRWKEEPSEEELGISMPLFDAKVNLSKLEWLKVSECNGLTNLFSSSTVKGMVYLKRITISKCKEMTEIIGNDHEGVVEREIVLKQLRYLELHDLPNLRCFYSGNSAITFPYLDDLVVSQCFEMKTFSHGIVNSPFLDKITTEPKDDGHASIDINIKQDSDGININSTIHKIYEEWRKKYESSSNEQITSEKDTTMGNNEPSTELTELSDGDQVKRDSWKGKEQATASSSS